VHYHINAGGVPAARSADIHSHTTYHYHSAALYHNMYHYASSLTCKHHNSNNDTSMYASSLKVCLEVSIEFTQNFS
jgi:hypothetical protein